jgi:protein-L-isoaspartate O-methyltransferase
VSANPPLSGAPSCDVGALPLVEEWPQLPSHQSHMTRLAQFGVIELDEVLEAMQQCPRGVHGLPFPLADEISHIEGSSIRIPWWGDVARPRSLLPGLFETSQIMQLLQIESGNSVLLMGPRGNWWTELLMYIGARHIVVLEPDEGRRQVLMQRWDDLRLDLVANAFGCQIHFIGTEMLDECTPVDGFDRILSTGMFPALPLSLMMRVQEKGYAVLPIENEGRSMLQLIQHHGEGELMSQWIACWDVDAWSEEVLIALETGAVVEMNDSKPNGQKAIERAWCEANAVPTRDRFGPDRMLDMVERVWFSIDPVHSDVPEGEVGGLRECLSDDLFRMGHVLVQMGIFELATEHLGEAFRLAPTAESATFVGWAMNEMDDAWAALGWCRKAIETDERLGNPWNDIGAILLQMEQPTAAIPWLAAATRSQRYDAPGHPWSNLARAHEALGNKMAAFDAARTALEHSPDDENCLRIIDDLSDSLL